MLRPATNSRRLPLLLLDPHSTLGLPTKFCQVNKQLQRHESTSTPSTNFAFPLLKVRNLDAPHIGHIRILGLNSPHNRNAISRQLLTELQAQLNRIKNNDGRRGGTRVLIIASEIDEAFCAGADLKERKGMSDEEWVFPSLVTNC